MILFIHRKDLRVYDLAAFDYIRKLGKASLHLLILDPHLLGRGRRLEHSGIHFLQHVVRLAELYRDAGQRLHVLYGEPADVVKRIVSLHRDIEEIVWHEDFTPYARQRERALADGAAEAGLRVTQLPDQPLADLRDFQQWTGRSEPYKVFTPFHRKWREYIHTFRRPGWATHVRDLRTAELDEAVLAAFPVPFELGAYRCALHPEAALGAFLREKLAGYAEGRDRFAEDGTSRLSRHLNVGALSIRAVFDALLAHGGHEAWLRQLAWRDFYLYQSLADPQFFSYESVYDLSALSDRHFQAWCEARTGIPIVDAAMTELAETGWMPNRLRMITAMFLTKNLLCPFTLGERYFRNKLADYDNALNRGGWLWSSSLGFDAAPYFRVMNPVTQSETYDPSGAYIRRWLPSLSHLQGNAIHQPQPHAIVELKASRARSIEVYKTILQQPVG